jgi:cobalt-zinc-cadmium efflux system outer membrane protein
MRPNGLGLRRILSGQVARLIDVRIQSLFVSLGLLFLAVSPALAQETGSMRLRTSATIVPSQPPSEPAWTLGELHELALSNNPTIGQAAASVDMARGIQKQVGLYPNPQLGYLRSDSNQGGATRTAGAFFGQEIVTRQKLKKAVDAEAWEVERGNLNYQAQTQRVLNDVQLRYLEVLGAQQSLQLANRLVQIAERGLSATEKLYEAKQVSKSDVLQARIQVKTVRITRKETEARLESAWHQLTNVIGCPDLKRAPVSGELLEGEVPEHDWNTTWTNLVANSPLLRAAEARSQHFQGQYQLEQANATPNLNLQIVAERDNAQQFSTLSTLISMPIPVINRNQGNIYRAAAETREAAGEIQRTKLALRDQLAETFRRYQTSKIQVQELKAEILPDAEENLQIANTAYRAAESSFLTVLTAQKTFFEVNLAYVDAWTELRKVSVEIDGLLLTGGLNPAELGTALQSQPGGGQRRAILNQMQEGTNNRLLPAALQTGG